MAQSSKDTARKWCKALVRAYLNSGELDGLRASSSALIYCTTGYTLTESNVNLYDIRTTEQCVSKCLGLGKFKEGRIYKVYSKFKNIPPIPNTTLPFGLEEKWCIVGCNAGLTNRLATNTVELDHTPNMSAKVLNAGLLPDPDER